MARKTVAVETVEASPRDVAAKWDAEGIDLATQIRRASSSRSWYRSALKTIKLEPATREMFERQASFYTSLLDRLRARRDAEARS